MVVGFQLYDPDMNELKFPVGVKPLDFLVSSIEKERYTENINGIPGTVDYGFDYKNRGDCSLTFFLRHFHDEHDYLLLESEINAFLDSQPFFYVSRNNLPTRVLKVTIDSSYKTERILGSMYATLEVPVNVTGLPFWQTKYTTQDIYMKTHNALTEKFGLADGIHDDYLNYSFTENSFSVWNGGNVTIDPRNMYLKITVNNLRSEGDFTIYNETTGEKFIYREKIAPTVLYLDGAKVLIVNYNRLRNTNRKFISLVPGENKISVLNGTYDNIKFDFSYYFK